MEKAKYINPRYDLDEEYRDDIRLERLMQRVDERLPREKEVEKVFVPVKRAMPRMEETSIEPIKRVTPKIIGSLFDRVDFLKARMDELMDQVKVRETLHKEMIREIDSDIEEKTAMISRLGDIDEIRNFKLDISILRKEKRQEHMLYWKDMMELKRELREISENFQMESKILKLFENLKTREV